jgi:hypothetical protein
MDKPKMLRCLFTDEQLGLETKVEHTIQRSIGGRIRSTQVSSNGFNEKCGSLIDPSVADLYWDVMCVLGPALPLDSRSGERTVEIPGEPGHYVIDEFGRLRMRGAAILGRDPNTRRPTAILGSDEDSVNRVARSMLPGTTWLTKTMPPSFNVRLRNRIVISPDIELAMLKAALLSFDHVLLGEDRFTRHDALYEVRSFIRRCIMERINADPYRMGQLVLGLQYDEDYLRLYRKIREEVEFAPSPFEHVLIASANKATGSLDVVFWAFGADPYAFRLCRNWKGGTFTYIVVNGILKNTKVSEPVKIDAGYVLGRATRWRSYQFVTPGSPSDGGEQLRKDLFARRSLLHQEAVDFAQRNFDEDVIDALGKLASLNEAGDHRLRTALADLLRVGFNSRIQSGDKRSQFDQALATVLAETPDEVCAPHHSGETTQNVNWPFWLARYRQCLDVLREPFGLPGDVFQTGGGEVMANVPGQRIP